MTKEATFKDAETARAEMHSTENQRICEMLVEREIVYCASQLVSFLLANCAEALETDGQAEYEEISSLSYSEEHEEPARYTGWIPEDETTDFSKARAIAENEDGFTFAKIEGGKAVEFSHAGGWRELCDDENIYAYESEIYEHWIVSDWMGEKLREQGETVVGMLGFNLWGRGTTGQAILLDSVIGRIASEMEILEGQRNDWSK